LRADLVGAGFARFVEVCWCSEEDCHNYSQ
jgi:hypothetical protein